jgi:hypothetical protein
VTGDARCESHHTTCEVLANAKVQPAACISKAQSAVRGFVVMGSACVFGSLRGAKPPPSPAVYLQCPAKRRPAYLMFDASWH